MESRVSAMPPNRQSHYGRLRPSTMPRATSPGLLLLVPVGSARCGLQFVVDLIQKVLGFLRVAFHVPFVGFLRGDYLLPGLLRQSLRGGKVGVACAGNIAGRLLGNGYTSHYERQAGDSGENTSLDGAHSRDPLLFVRNHLGFYIRNAGAGLATLLVA